MNTDSLKSGVATLQFYGIRLLDSCIFSSGKLAGRIIFPVKLMTNWKQNIDHPSYFSECELKSKYKIFAEQFLYILRTGEINKNYFIYGFDRKFKNDFKNYVPWLTFTRARNIKNQWPEKPEYDPYNSVCLLRDKFVFGAFCKSVGIKTPNNIGMMNEGQLYLIENNHFVSVDNIVTCEMDAICKRNVSYGGGMSKDILRLTIANGVARINDEEVSPAELREYFGHDCWIIQERIKNQNPEYAKFHPSSINTVRVVTVKDGPNVTILCCFFRMGVNSRHTDNCSSGGITTGINIENGTLEKWGVYKPEFGAKVDKHPNSLILFEGHKLPHWEEIIQYVKKAHLLFYGLHSIGWDVAITTDGIMLIEGNDNWDTTSVQLYGGAKKKFDKYFK